MPNKSIAILDINKLLILKEKWPKSFISNPTIKDIIQKILKYILINISPKKKNPRNIN